MRLHYKLVIVFMLLSAGFVSPVYGDTLDDNYKYQKPIIGVNTRGYKYVELDNDVYKYSKESLDDLRVIDKKGDYIPFFIEGNRTEVNYSVVNSYTSNLIKTFNKLNSHYFDFQVNKEEKKDVLINYMKLDIENNGNYAKTIEIYGSYDNEYWEFITQQEVYEIKSESETEINFDSLLKYEYYRIVILDNIEFLSINNIQLENIKNEDETFPFNRKMPVTYNVVNKSGSKTTEIEIENFANSRLIDIKLEIEGDFYREYELYDSLDNYVSSGELSKNISNIIFSESNNSKKLKLIIDNKDDKPLIIESIIGNYAIEYVVFYAKEKGEYYLNFGNELAIAPIYDIIYSKDKISLKEKVELGKIKELDIDENSNSNFISEKYILNGIIGIVSILLVFVLIKAIKKD